MTESVEQSSLTESVEQSSLTESVEQSSLTESANTTPKRPDWLVPGYPELKGLVGEAAVNGQVVNYPAVARTRVDAPIMNQAISLVSFMLFKEPKKLRNGKLVYGYLKNRGNYPDEDSAINASHKIIREQDSKFKILLAPVGHFLPITEEDGFCKETIDVRTSDEEKHLQDLAMKEKMKEADRIKREIKEREDELKNDGDIYDDPTSLTYYSMRRVTEMKLCEEMARLKNQMDSVTSTHISVLKELKRLERDNPSYNGEWVDRYNEERRKSGIPDYIPAEAELRAYESYTFSDGELEEEEK